MLSTLGLIAGITLMIVGMIVTTFAVRTLPPEKKAALVDKFTYRSAFGIIPVILVVVAYYIALKYSNIDSQVLLVAYFITLTAIIVFFGFFDAKRIRALELGSAYIRQYSIGRMLTFGGIAFILVAIISERG